MVLGHVANGYLSANMYPESVSLPVIHSVIYSFHMALFMIISGYLYYTAYFDNNGSPRKERLYRQVLNLTVMYVVFNIAFGLFKVLCGRFTNQSTSILDVLLTPVKPIAPYWYLYLLIFYYLIFSCRKIRDYNSWLTFIVLAVVSIIGDFNLGYWFEFRCFLYFAFFFYLGILFRKNEKIFFGNKIVTVVLFVIAVAGIAFKISGVTNSVPVPVAKVINVITALGISQALWYVFEHCKFFGENKLFELCGRYCLEIYVIHCVFTAGSRAIFPKFILDNYILSVMLNFIISTTIPILFSMLCKKLNIHGLFFKPVTYIANLRDKNKQK